MLHRSMRYWNKVYQKGLTDWTLKNEKINTKDQVLYSSASMQIKHLTVELIIMLFFSTEMKISLYQL